MLQVAVDVGACACVGVCVCGKVHSCDRSIAKSGLMQITLTRYWQTVLVDCERLIPLTGAEQRQRKKKTVDQQQNTWSKENSHLVFF